jgi:ribonuclease HII
MIEKVPHLRPDFGLEAAQGATQGKRICGLDEVGRGPIAGPVVAAAVIFPPGGVPAELAAEIDDSKRLSAAARERLAPQIQAHALAWALGRAEVEEIDRLNILQAALLAMERAVAGLGVAPDYALVDGNRLPRLPCPAQAVVKGDRRSLSIAAASIVAKVFRDNEMSALSKLYPHYGWAENAGYPTAGHRAALKRHGVTPHHRVTFSTVREELLIRR